MENIRIQRLARFEFHSLTDGIYSFQFIVLVFTQIKIVFQKSLDSEGISVVGRLFLPLSIISFQFSLNETPRKTLLVISAAKSFALMPRVGKKSAKARFSVLQVYV